MKNLQHLLGVVKSKYKVQKMPVLDKFGRPFVWENREFI